MSEDKSNKQQNQAKTSLTSSKIKLLIFFIDGFRNAARPKLFLTKYDDSIEKCSLAHHMAKV